jgi:hypothetical protein
MRAEPSAFGAFYRRFEDEILGWFLARGAKPEVAADLTAETFAAAMPGRGRKRLLRMARSTLEASASAGRVVADARRGNRVPTLALTGDSLARVAALDRSEFAQPRELLVGSQDDVQVRVIDEQLAAGLKLSDAVVPGRVPDPDADAAANGTLRIPELEAALAAARPRGRARGPVVIAAGLAVAALAVLAFARGSDDSHVASLSKSPSLRLERTSSMKEIARVGNGWAPTFAASDGHSCVLDMTERACARAVCGEAGDAFEHCVPLSRAAKRSFRDATVQEVTIRTDWAGARFSNGLTVEFVRALPDSAWQVDAVGTKPDRRLLERNGNSWAHFFAASRDRICVDDMTRTACERATCEGISGRVAGCTPVSAGFRHSFRDAVIRDVLVMTADRAVARFTNGQIVEFAYIQDGGGRWWADRLGADAGRGLLHR